MLRCFRCFGSLLAQLLVATCPAAAASDHPAKVILIGVDGVSFNLLTPYSEKGVTPTLNRLMQSGARGDLASIWPLRTPQVWTSVVTGKLPGQHGIWDHLSNTYFNPPEVRTHRKRVVTTEHRKSKALWNLLSERQLTSLVVGWMASWPAENLEHGVVVAPVELMGDSRQTTIKGSFWRDAKGMLHRESLWPSVEKLIVEAGDLEPGALAPFADVPPKGSRLYQMPHLARYVYAISWSLARARSVEAMTIELAKTVRPDLVLAYFQCSDSLLHRFWIFSQEEAEIRERFKSHGLSTRDVPELRKRFGGVVEACYRDLDMRIGRILEATAGPNTLVLVVSDHGFGNAPEPHRMEGEPFSGAHLDDGVIIAGGPGIKAGLRLQGASVLDITPTILHALHLPVADDMGGKVLVELFDSEAIKLRPIDRLPTFEDAPQTVVLRPEGFPPKKSVR